MEERRRAETEALRDKLVQSERKNTEVIGTFLECLGFSIYSNFDLGTAI